MGQGSSSQRQPQGPEHPDFAQSTQRYQELGDDNNAASGVVANDGDVEDLSRTTPVQPSALARISSLTARHPDYHSTYRRETRARSTLISGDLGVENADGHGRDDVVLEQEERPLILRDMEVRLNDAPITDIQAAPMPRRTSVLSRLSSRVSRRHSFRPSRQSEAAADDGERLTSRPVSDDLTHAQIVRQPETPPRRNRFSMFDLPTQSLIAPRHTSHHRRSSVSHPPSSAAIAATAATAEYSTDPEAVHPENLTSNNVDSAELASHSNSDITSDTAVPSGSQRSRQFRRSLLAPFSQLIHSTRARQQRDRPSSQRQEHAAEEMANLISPQGTGTDASVSENPARNVRSGTEEGSEMNPAELDSPDRPTSWFSSSRDSVEQPGSEVRRGGRRMQQLLRGRSSRLIGGEDRTPLSHVLQVAAAAIAAQLSGSTDTSPDLQSVGDDYFDGNLNAFIQSLNTAAEASTNTDEDSNITTLPQLNFWRVFRFVNSSSSSSSSSSRDDRSSTDQSSSAQAEGGSRLVTLVVVGVRSVPSSTLASDTEGTLNANLDGVLALPSTPPGSLSFTPGPASDNTSTRSRLTRRNRTSFTGINPSPSQSENQRTMSSTANRLSRATARNPLRRSPGTLRDGTQVRPPSPFPDGRFTGQFPSVDDQSADQSLPSTSSSRESTFEQGPTTTQARAEEPAVSSIRQRPRSESHGHLGSGAARRNGVVEPDGASGNNRHWLIYVVGTNLSEDHPAFQAPSLFTDNPSYEDMLMLSALLGPAKPPVASAQDVASADGVYRLEIRRSEGPWMARLLDRAEGNDGVASPLVEMADDVERCLVCLTDYDSGDEIRQLQNCSHVFHRECIDTWLTTGRNSCPLCRGQGVDEKPGETRPEGSPNMEIGAA